MLEHNDHKCCYQSIEEWSETSGKMFHWVSEDEYRKAVVINNVWTIQCYPDTPVGFYAYAASDLGALLKHVGCPTFADRIVAMNRKYELPVHDVPTLNYDVGRRTHQFKSIMFKEISEIEDIQTLLMLDKTPEPVDVLVAIADLLSDITVYCRSEAARYGIPLEEVLQIVMDSNDTKLGADGLPIKDADGKFLKGPNFVPPEPAIRQLLLEKMK